MACPFLFGWGRMEIKMTAVEIKEVAKKYHLRFLSNSGRAQAWALFEQVLEPAEIVSQNLLPGLREITIISYYSEWGRRQK